MSAFPGNHAEIGLKMLTYGKSLAIGMIGKVEGQTNLLPCLSSHSCQPKTKSWRAESLSSFCPRLK